MKKTGKEAPSKRDILKAVSSPPWVSLLPVLGAVGCVWWVWGLYLFFPAHDPDPQAVQRAVWRALSPVSDWILPTLAILAGVQSAVVIALVIDSSAKTRGANSQARASKAWRDQQRALNSAMHSFGTALDMGRNLLLIGVFASSLLSLSAPSDRRVELACRLVVVCALSWYLGTVKWAAVTPADPQVRLRKHERALAEYEDYLAQSGVDPDLITGHRRTVPWFLQPLLDLGVFVVLLIPVGMIGAVVEGPQPRWGVVAYGVGVSALVFLFGSWAQRSLSVSPKRGSGRWLEVGLFVMIGPLVVLIAVLTALQVEQNKPAAAVVVGGSGLIALSLLMFRRATARRLHSPGKVSILADAIQGGPQLRSMVTGQRKTLYGDVQRWERELAEEKRNFARAERNSLTRRRLLSDLQTGSRS